MTIKTDGDVQEITNHSAPSSLGRFIQRFDAGETVFCEGDKGNEMFIVLKGAVGISKASKEGLIHLATFRSGEIFGEMALFEQEGRTGTALIEENGTELMSVNEARFIYLVSQQPAFALTVMRVLCRRLAAMNVRLIQKNQSV